MKHSLVEIRANKEYRGKYGISGKGYPRIIVRKAEVSQEIDGEQLTG